MMLTTRKQEQGFTILELLFVSVLLALMAGILYSSITGIMRSREAVEDQRATTKVAQSIFSRFITEFSSITAGSKLSDSKDCFNPCPIEGKNKGSGKNASDQIRFISLNASQPIAGAIGNNGLVEVSYKLKKNSSKSPFYDPDQDKNLKVLIREEVPAGIDDKKILKAKRITTPLAYNVSSLNFRYLINTVLNQTWENKWDRTRKAQPPIAIEITLGIKGENGRKEVFRTAVHIPSAKRDTARGGAGGVGGAGGGALPFPTTPPTL